MPLPRTLLSIPDIPDADASAAQIGDLILCDTKDCDHNMNSGGYVSLQPSGEITRRSCPAHKDVNDPFLVYIKGDQLGCQFAVLGVHGQVVGRCHNHKSDRKGSTSIYCTLHTDVMAGKHKHPIEDELVRLSQDPTRPKCATDGCIVPVEGCLWITDGQAPSFFCTRAHVPEGTRAKPRCELPDAVQDEIVQSRSTNRSDARCIFGYDKKLAGRCNSIIQSRADMDALQPLCDGHKACMDRLLYMIRTGGRVCAHANCSLPGNVCRYGDFDRLGQLTQVFCSVAHLPRGHGGQA